MCYREHKSSARRIAKTSKLRVEIKNNNNNKKQNQILSRFDLFRRELLRLITHVYT